MAWLLWVDCVEKVAARLRGPRASVAEGAAELGSRRFSGRIWLRRQDQLGKLPQVLGGCGEMELVAGAIGSSEA